MRSLFMRWSVAVVVGLLWGAVLPAARPRAERAHPSQTASGQRVNTAPTSR